jgi:hypothetical protein
MGHTHEPRFDRVARDAFYVNLGNWGEDELHEDREGHRTLAPSTFMELRRSARGSVTARLMRWTEDAAPELLFDAPGREPEHVPTRDAEAALDLVTT